MVQKNTINKELDMFKGVKFKPRRGGNERGEREAREPYMQRKQHVWWSAVGKCKHASKEAGLGWITQGSEGESPVRPSRSVFRLPSVWASSQPTGDRLEVPTER